MRRMNTRQAKTLLASLLALLTVLTACSPLPQPVSTAASLPSPAPSKTSTALPATAIPLTPTPLACLTQPGRVEEGVLNEFTPAQEFRVYLPPCYDEKPDEHYPVLYLLHGQTYTDDQWVRLGAVDAADTLIRSGRASPFIVVFPDDRYWNLPPGPGFGQRLVDELIPHIDATYRTLPDRKHRAIGGLSRGAGWALRLGLTEWKLCSSIGLHSLAVLQGDASDIEEWLKDIPPSARPRVFMDIGDNDPEISMARRVESQLNDYGITHEWHLYGGAHTEDYWGAHVEEYIAWYAKGWRVSNSE